MNNATEEWTAQPRQFDWTEYLSFGLMLTFSILIGLYFGFRKGGQKTVAEYLLGDKKMTVFPIAMSLISSQISGVTLLGVPAEIYSYGTQYVGAIIANVAVASITLFIFLPVFHNLQLVSLYEYLELRFNHSVRVLASLFYALSLMTFIPIVIYGPALAFNQVSGLNIHIITPLISIICIFYTTLGGLKAVVWTDALQGVIMLFTGFAVIIIGVLKAGGVSAIFQAASEGDRLEFFNMSVDPTTRLSFWSSTIGLTFTWAAYVAVDPAAVQRFISLPTLREAKWTTVFLCLGINVFAISSMFLGLIMYAVYKDCDPVSAKIVNRNDQVLPYFVLDVAGHIRGLSGLFVVGACSAALSTMSTGLNTVAGTIFEDFVQPCFRKKVSDERASFIIKMIVAIAGTICVLLVVVIEKLGAILEVASSFGGVTSGASLGIFALGVLFPTANTTGALVGGLVSICFMSWIMIGSQIATANGLINYPTKAMSVQGCAANVTNILVRTAGSGVDDKVWPLYRLSLFYFGLVGCLLVIVVGLIVSHLTGPLKPGTVHRRLLSPVIHRFLPPTPSPERELTTHKNIPVANLEASDTEDVVPLLRPTSMEEII